jgi:hypothetical protein
LAAQEPLHPVEMSRDGKCGATTERASARSHGENVTIGVRETCLLRSTRKRSLEEFIHLEPVASTASLSKGALPFPHRLFCGERGAGTFMSPNVFPSVPVGPAGGTKAMADSAANAMGSSWPVKPVGDSTTGKCSIIFGAVSGAAWIPRAAPRPKKSHKSKAEQAARAERRAIREAYQRAKALALAEGRPAPPPPAALVRPKRTKEETKTRKASKLHGRQKREDTREAARDGSKRKGQANPIDRRKAVQLRGVMQDYN